MTLSSTRTWAGGPIEQEDDESKTPSHLDPHRRRRPVEVRLSVFKAHLVAIMKGRKQLLRLPLVLFLFVAFLLYSQAHMQVESVHQIEVSIENAYLKTQGPPPDNHVFTDLHTVGEFWNWMHDVFAPVTFAENTDSKHITGRIVVFNQLIGGIRLLQRRSKPAPCKNHDLDSFYGSECHPFHAERESRPFGKPICQPANSNSTLSDSGVECVDASKYYPPLKAAEQRSGLSIDTGFTSKKAEHGGQLQVLYETYFDNTDTLQEAENRVRYLEDRQWIDAQTDDVEIILTVYNGELSIFCEMILQMHFERGGYVREDVTIGSVRLHQTGSTDVFVLIIDVIWYACVAFLLLREILDLRNYGRRGLWNFWNQLSLLTIALSIFLAVYWHVFLVPEVDDVAGEIARSSHALTLVNHTSDTLESQTLRHSEIDHIQDRIAIAIGHKSTYRVCTVINLFLLLFQIFEVFLAAPRLAIILITFKNAMSDLLHFLFVFVFIFVAFAYGGFILFGHQLEAFSTLSEACITCFLLLLGEGVAVYEDIKHVAPTVGFVWWVTFLLFGMLTLLQMVVAIILDNYSFAQASTQRGHTVSVFAQATHFLGDAYRHAFGRILGTNSATSSDLLTLCVFKIALDTTIGRPCDDDGDDGDDNANGDRWICATDLVAAATGWNYPVHAGAYASCCTHILTSKGGTRGRAHERVSSEQGQHALKGPRTGLWRDSGSGAAVAGTKTSDGDSGKGGGTSVVPVMEASVGRDDNVADDTTVVAAVTMGHAFPAISLGHAEAALLFCLDSESKV